MRAMPRGTPGLRVLSGCSILGRYGTDRRQTIVLLYSLRERERVEYSIERERATFAVWQMR
jgi:hypothetical protein